MLRNVETTASCRFSASRALLEHAGALATGSAMDLAATVVSAVRENRAVLNGVRLILGQLSELIPD